MKPAVRPLRSEDFLSQEGYLSLSAHQRLFIREVLDYMWSERGECQLPKDSSQILEALKWGRQDADALLSEGIPTLSGVLEESFDLATGEFILSSPLLKKAQAELKEWERQQEEEVRRLNNSRRRNTMAGQIQAAQEDPAVIYVNPAERSNPTYQGWLPTFKFESNGQALNIRKDLIAELRSSYPAEDINNHLSEMYSWLMKNPSRRKRLAGMNQFIHNWISAEKEINPGDSSVSSSIDDAFGSLFAKAGA